MESIIRIMDVIGIDDLMKAKRHYVRVARKWLESNVYIIGNIIGDKWFDYRTFFSESTENTSAENSDKDNADTNAKANTDTDYVPKAQDLYARMQKWADEHNTDGCPNDRYTVNYNTLVKDWGTVKCCDHYYPFEIYFSTRKIAEQALEEFKSELEEVFINSVWKQRLND